MKLWLLPLCVAVVAAPVSTEAHAGQPAPAARECSAEALPAQERRAMEARFHQIDRDQGREAAMAYAREQGRLFSQRLIDEGVCTEDGQTVTATAPESESSEDGCRMVMRPIAGFGGAMSMGMVPECD